MGFGALFAWVWLPDVQDPREVRKGTASLESGDRPVTLVGDDGENGSSQQEAGGAESEAQSQKGFWLEKYKVPSKPLEELADRKSTRLNSSH